jgi:trimeric autotransporter adhesin
MLQDCNCRLKPSPSAHLTYWLFAAAQDDRPPTATVRENAGAKMATIHQRRCALLSGCAIVSIIAGATFVAPPAAAQFVCVGNSTGATVGDGVVGTTASGGGSTAAGTLGNLACGITANASGTSSSNSAIGLFSNAAGDNSSNIANGVLADASGNNSINIATGNSSRAFGDGSNNTAYGFVADAHGNTSVNIATVRQRQWQY